MLAMMGWGRLLNVWAEIPTLIETPTTAVKRRTLTVGGPGGGGAVVCLG